MKNTKTTKELTLREVASLGGIARAKKLSPERRKEIASLGGKARVKKLSTTKIELTSKK